MHRRLEEGLRFANLHQLAEVEDGSTVAEPPDGRQIMRDEQVGDAEPTLQIAEEIEAAFVARLDTRQPVRLLTHSSGATDCKWSTPSGFPAVELEVDWGDGEVAMRAAAMMNKREPGITSPYDGLGDQAIAVGPALMIQTGEDLMKMVFTGVTDAPAKAQKIFTAAKARM